MEEVPKPPLGEKASLYVTSGGGPAGLGEQSRGPAAAPELSVPRQDSSELSSQCGPDFRASEFIYALCDVSKGLAKSLEPESSTLDTGSPQISNPLPYPPPTPKEA